MSKNKQQNLAILGMFCAIIVVLQLLSYVIKIGAFNLSLVLIPIVLGAYLYGPKAGAVLGAAFGVTVTICCFTGMDAGGYILVSASPLLTSAICLVKGIAAGFSAGIVSKLLKGKNESLAITVAAIISPIVNTGLFCTAMFLFFKDILTEWAGGTDLVTYIIVGLTGVNFLIELLLNIIAAPSLLRITKAIK